MDSSKPMTGHAIVGGCGHLGSRIASGLLERGLSVTLVEKCFDDGVVARMESAGYVLIRGDVRDDDILIQAGIGHADCFIAVTGDDRANLESAITAREMNDRCAVVARLYDQTLGERVEKAFGIRALSASFLASPAYISAATDDAIVSALTIDGCCIGIHARSAKPVKAKGHYVKISEDGLDLCDYDGAGESCFFASVHGSSRGLYHKRQRRKSAGRRPLTSAMSFLNPIALAQEVINTWTRAALITKRLTVALLAVAGVSVAVFSASGRMSPLDALYFVVTTMTTVGYGDINLQHAPTGLKVFGIVMMIAGAALLATVYAIIADRVIEARLEFLLGRRRVPMRGHTIVVGLGKVGYRVARGLRSLGLDVVGIEAVEDLDNVSAARTAFPVIIGDASRTSILNKASVDSAETILALTDDPMLNLSIALDARERNPKIRTIVRTYDAALAGKFSSLGLDATLSTSAIAAPAFIDAAIHPGVQGSFRANDQDILVARYTIDQGSPLHDRTPADIGAGMGIAVIAATDGVHPEYRPTALDKPLSEGQKVLALLSRSSVDRT